MLLLSSAQGLISMQQNQSWKKKIFLWFLNYSFRKKKYSCKLVRAWRGIISVSFHIYAHAAKPICLHLPTILTVNKVVRPYDIVMNKVKVLDDPVNPLLETSLNPFRVGSSDLLLMFLIKHYNDITLSHSWYLSCNDWVK